jgi:hypothetical protein
MSFYFFLFSISNENTFDCLKIPFIYLFDKSVDITCTPNYSYLWLFWVYIVSTIHTMFLNFLKYEAISICNMQKWPQSKKL